MSRRVPVGNEALGGGSSRQSKQGPHPRTPGGPAGGRGLYEGHQGLQSHHQEHWSNGYGGAGCGRGRGGAGHGQWIDGYGQGGDGHGQGSGNQRQAGGGCQQGAGHGQGGGGSEQGGGGYGQKGGGREKGDSHGQDGGGRGQGGAGHGQGRGYGLGVEGYEQGGRGWGRGSQHDDDDPHPLRDPYKYYVSDGPDYTKHVHTKQAHKDLGDADHDEKDPRRGNDDDGEWHPKEQPTVYPASVKMPPLNPPDKGYSFNIRNLSVFKEQGRALNVGPSEAGYTMDQQHHWQDH